jgi:hypothetical protein
MNDNLNHNWQTNAAGAWAGKTRLSGASAKQIAVGQNADGRLEIFYSAMNDSLYQNWQTSPGGAWAGEARFIGDRAKQIAVGRHSDGRLQILCRRAQ